jgi:hypothetical protein
MGQDLPSKKDAIPIGKHGRHDDTWRLPANRPERLDLSDVAAELAIVALRDFGPVAHSVSLVKKPARAMPRRLTSKRCHRNGVTQYDILLI